MINLKNNNMIQKIFIFCKILMLLYFFFFFFFLKKKKKLDYFISISNNFILILNLKIVKREVKINN